MVWHIRSMVALLARLNLDSNTHDPTFRFSHCAHGADDAIYDYGILRTRIPILMYSLTRSDFAVRRPGREQISRLASKNGNYGVNTSLDDLELNQGKLTMISAQSELVRSSFLHEPLLGSKK